MPKPMLPALCFAAATLFSGAALAQTAPAFEKKNFNYSEWAKGRFSEAVTVTGPAKMIFLAGVGAEDENGKGGDILYKGDFAAQCKYAYDKIRRALEKNGAGFGDVVKIVSYVTDMRHQAEYGKCRRRFGLRGLSSASSGRGRRERLRPAGRRLFQSDLAALGSGGREEVR
jgi:2-iminobutanoate/2-iminopropanoate deaminase